MFEDATSDVATRQDVDRLAERLANEWMRLDANIETHWASIRNVIKDMKRDLIKWIIGGFTLIFLGNAGLMITLIHNVRP